MKDTKEIKRYLIIGSNNFWYAMCNSLKEAQEQAKEIMSTESYEEESAEYGDEESGHKPFRPETLYIYKAYEVERVETETCEAQVGEDWCGEIATHKIGKDHYCAEHYEEFKTR